MQLSLVLSISTSIASGNQQKTYGLRRACYENQPWYNTSFYYDDTVVAAGSAATVVIVTLSKTAPPPTFLLYNNRRQLLRHKKSIYIYFSHDSKQHAVEQQHQQPGTIKIHAVGRHCRSKAERRHHTHQQDLYHEYNTLRNTTVAIAASTTRPKAIHTPRPVADPDTGYTHSCREAGTTTAVPQTHVVGAKLEKDVDVLSVLEKHLETHHARVLEGPVDLDFRLKLRQK